MKMAIWIVFWFLLGTFVASLAGCECVFYKPFEPMETSQ